MQHVHRRVLLIAFCAASFARAAAGGAAPRDYGQITCHNFLASGLTNMGYIIWWLRGYHAGTRGVRVFDPGDAYAARLGYHCRNHPLANLIDASERILSQLDGGL